jgi:hypothetical protein
MAISTTDLLGTSSFGQSRIIINTNTAALRDAYNNLETAFGISVVSGNIDVSGMPGGVIKAKQLVSNIATLPTAGLPSITLTGASGNVSCVSATVSATMTSASAVTTNLTVASSGSAVFNSPATFNSVAEFVDGLSHGPKLDLGTITAHTVINADGTLIFDCGSTLTLTADAALVDGHTVTLVYKGVTLGVTLSSSSILGGLTATFAAVPYKSSITLTYDLASGRWIVVGAVNCTVA